MNRLLLPACVLLLLPGCSAWRSTLSGMNTAGSAVVDGAKYVGGAVVTGSKKAASAVSSGAGSLGRYAVDLMPWSNAADERKKADPTGVKRDGVAPVTTARKPAPAEPAKPAAPSFPPGASLLVGESNLGAAATRAEFQKIPLPGGWQVSGPLCAWRVTAVDDYPAYFRASGGPCTATSGEADTLVTATAREIHYRKDSGVLVLNGEPVLKAGNQTLKATGTGAMIKIRLATGAVGVDGQAQWSAD